MLSSSPAKWEADVQLEQWEQWRQEAKNPRKLAEDECACNVIANESPANGTSAAERAGSKAYRIAWHQTEAAAGHRVSCAGKHTTKPHSLQAYHDIAPGLR